MTLGDRRFGIVAQALELINSFKRHFVREMYAPR